MDSSMEGLVAAIRKHAGFKRLAAYSIKALRKSATPPSSGWVAQADAAFKFGAVEAIRNLVERNCAAESSDCEILADASMQLQAIAAAGRGAMLLRQMAGDRAEAAADALIDWADRSADADEAAFSAGGEGCADLGANAATGGGWHAARGFWQAVKASRAGGVLSRDDLAVASAAAEGLAGTLRICAAQSPTDFIRFGGASIVAAFLPAGSLEDDGTFAVQAPDDALHSPRLLRLALQAMDAATARARSAAAVLPFLVPGQGASCVASLEPALAASGAGHSGAAAASGAASAAKGASGRGAAPGRSPLEALLDGARVAEGGASENRHLAPAMRTLDRITRLSGAAVLRLRALQAVARLASAVEWLQQRGGDAGAAAAARAGVRVLSRVLGPDLLALLERASGRSAGAGSADVPVREAVFSARLLASLTASRGVAERCALQPGFVSRLVGLLSVGDEPDFRGAAGDNVCAVNGRAREGLCRVAEHIAEASSVAAAALMAEGAVPRLHRLARATVESDDADSDELRDADGPAANLAESLQGSALAALAAIAKCSAPCALAVATSRLPDTSFSGVAGKDAHLSLPVWAARLLADEGEASVRVGEGALLLCAALLAWARGHAGASRESGAIRDAVDVDAMTEAGLVAGAVDVLRSRPGGVSVQLAGISLVADAVAVLGAPGAEEAADAGVLDVVTVALHGHGVNRSGPFRHVGQSGLSRLESHAGRASMARGMSFAAVSPGGSSSPGMAGQRRMSRRPSSSVFYGPDGRSASRSGAAWRAAASVNDVPKQLLDCVLVPPVLDGPAATSQEDSAVCIAALELAARIVETTAPPGEEGAALGPAAGELKRLGVLRAMLSASRRAAQAHLDDALFEGAFVRLVELVVAKRDVWAALCRVSDGTRVLRARSAAADLFAIADAEMEAAGMAESTLPTMAEAPKAPTAAPADQKSAADAGDDGRVRGESGEAVGRELVDELCLLEAVGVSLRLGREMVLARATTVLCRIVTTASTLRGVPVRRQRGPGRRQAAAGASSPSGGTRSRTGSASVDSELTEPTQEEVLQRSQSCLARLARLAAPLLVRRMSVGRGGAMASSRDRHVAQALLEGDSPPSAAEAPAAAHGTSRESSRPAPFAASAFTSLVADLGAKAMAASSATWRVAQGRPLLRAAIEAAAEAVAQLRASAARSNHDEIRDQVGRASVVAAIARTCLRAMAQRAALRGCAAGGAAVVCALGLCGPGRVFDTVSASPSGLSVAVEAGGVEAVVAALRAHGPSVAKSAEGSSFALEAACRALAAASVWEHGAEAASTRGGTRQVVRELAAASEAVSAGRGSRWFGPEGQRTLILLVSVLDGCSDWPSTAGLLRKQGAVDAIIATLEAGAPAPQVAEAPAGGRATHASRSRADGAGAAGRAGSGGAGRRGPGGKAGSINSGGGDDVASGGGGGDEDALAGPASSASADHSQAAQDVMIAVLTKLLDASSVETAVKVIEATNRLCSSGSLTLANTRLAAVALTTLRALSGTATGRAAPESVWRRCVVACSELLHFARAAASRRSAGRGGAAIPRSAVSVALSAFGPQAAAVAASVLKDFAPRGSDTGAGLMLLQSSAAATPASYVDVDWAGTAAAFASRIVAVVSRHGHAGGSAAAAASGAGNSAKGSSVASLEDDADDDVAGGSVLLAALLDSAASAALHGAGARELLAGKAGALVSLRIAEAVELASAADDVGAGEHGQQTAGESLAKAAARAARAMAEAAAGPSVCGPHVLSAGLKPRDMLVQTATSLASAARAAMKHSMEAGSASVAADSLRTLAAIAAATSSPKLSVSMGAMGGAAEVIQEGGSWAADLSRAAAAATFRFSGPKETSPSEAVLRAASRAGCAVAFATRIGGSLLSDAKTAIIPLADVRAAAVSAGGQPLTSDTTAMGVLLAVLDGLRGAQGADSGAPASTAAADAESSSASQRSGLRSGVSSPQWGLSQAFHLIADTLSEERCRQLADHYVASGQADDGSTAEDVAMEVLESLRALLRARGARGAVEAAMALPDAGTDLLRAGARALSALDGEADDGRPGLSAAVLQAAGEASRACTAVMCAVADAESGGAAAAHAGEGGAGKDVLSQLGAALGRASKAHSSLSGSLRALAAALAGEDPDSLSGAVARHIHISMRAAVSAARAIAAVIARGSAAAEALVAGLEADGEESDLAGAAAASAGSSLLGGLRSELGAGLEQVAGSLMAGGGGPLTSGGSAGGEEAGRLARANSARRRPSSIGGGTLGAPGGSSAAMLKSLGQRAVAAAVKSLGNVAVSAVQASGRLALAQGSSSASAGRKLRPTERAKYLGRSAATSAEWPSALPCSSSLSDSAGCGEAAGPVSAYEGIDCVVEGLQCLAQAPAGARVADGPASALASLEPAGSAADHLVPPNSADAAAVVEAAKGSIRELCTAPDTAGPSSSSSSSLEGAWAAASRGLAFVLAALASPAVRALGGGRVVELARSCLGDIVAAAAADGAALAAALSSSGGTEVLGQLLLAATECAGAETEFGAECIWEASGAGEDARPSIFASPVVAVAMQAMQEGGLPSEASISPALWLLARSVVSGALQSGRAALGPAAAAMAPSADGRFLVGKVGFEACMPAVSSVLAHGLRPTPPPGCLVPPAVPRTSASFLQAAAAFSVAMRFAVPCVESEAIAGSAASYDRVVLTLDPAAHGAIGSCVAACAEGMLDSHAAVARRAARSAGAKGHDEVERTAAGLVRLQGLTVAMLADVVAHCALDEERFAAWGGAEARSALERSVSIALRLGGFEAATADSTGSPGATSAEADSLAEPEEPLHGGAGAPGGGAAGSSGSDDADGRRIAVHAASRAACALGSLQLLRRACGLEFSDCAVDARTSARASAVAATGAVRLVCLSLDWHGAEPEFASEACRFIADACVACAGTGHAPPSAAEVGADEDDPWDELSGRLNGAVTATSVRSCLLNERCLRSLQSVVSRLGDSSTRVRVSGGALIDALSQVYERRSARGFLRAIERATAALDALATALAALEDVCEHLPISAVPVVPPEQIARLVKHCKSLLADPGPTSAILMALARCTDRTANTVALCAEGGVKVAVSAATLHGARNSYLADAVSGLVRAVTIQLDLLPVVKKAGAVPVLVYLADAHNGNNPDDRGQPLRGFMRATGLCGHLVEEDVVASIAPRRRKARLSTPSQQAAAVASTAAAAAAAGSASSDAADGGLSSAMDLAAEESAWYESGFGSALDEEGSDATEEAAASDASTGLPLVGDYRPNARKSRPGEEESPLTEPRVTHFCVQALANVACDASLDDDPASIPGYGKSPGAELVDGATSGVVRIVAAGGVELLSRVMQRHMRRPRLLEDAVCTLSNLAYTSDAIRLRIGSTCAKQVVGLLRAFSRDAMLFNMALRAVGNLTRCDENIIEVTAAGAASAMAVGVEEMVRQGKWRVIRVAADVVGNIASFEESAYTGRASGVDRARREMRTGERRRKRREQKRIDAGGDAEDSHVARALRAGFPEVQDAAPLAHWVLAFLGAEGVVESIIGAMAAFPTKSSMVAACFRALQAVCEVPSFAAVAAHGLQGAPAIVRAMRACDYDVSVSERGLLLLGLLLRCSDSEARTFVLDCGTGPLMLSLLDTHASSPHVVLAALQSLDSAGAGSCESHNHLKEAEANELAAIESRLEVIAEAAMGNADGGEHDGVLKALGASIGVRHFAFPKPDVPDRSVDGAQDALDEADESASPFTEGMQMLRSAWEMDAVRSVMRVVRASLPCLSRPGTGAALQEVQAGPARSSRSRGSTADPDEDDASELALAALDAETASVPTQDLRALPSGETVVLACMRLLSSWARHARLAARVGVAAAEVASDLSVLLAADKFSSQDRASMGERLKRLQPLQAASEALLSMRLKASREGTSAVEAKGPLLRQVWLALAVAATHPQAARACADQGALQAVRSVPAVIDADIDALVLLRVAEALRGLVCACAPRGWMLKVKRSAGLADDGELLDWAEQDGSEDAAVASAATASALDEDLAAACAADDGSDQAMRTCVQESAELVGVWLATVFALGHDKFGYTQASSCVRVARRFRLFQETADLDGRDVATDGAAAAADAGSAGAAAVNRGDPEADAKAMQLAEPGVMPWRQFPRAAIEALAAGMQADVWFTPTMHPKAKLKSRKMALEASEDLSSLSWSYSSLRFKRALRWRINLAGVAAVRLGLPLGKRRRNVFARNPAPAKSVSVDGPILPGELSHNDSPIPASQAAAVGKVAAEDYVLAGVATVLHLEGPNPSAARQLFAALAALVPFAKAGALPVPGTVGEHRKKGKQSVMRRPSVRGWWAGGDAAGAGDSSDDE
ncbi:hypothetical protein FNF27_03224 [Cafeteria roenbergensis]|uniref:Uncharacterized protein n=2 Tax=Cafeteria roenbergensis TaxID=33653 RepID=A0A5A8EBK7_CAFRO|nr:hypothetical protein FNF27_03224 [Cafeteria roenbergensis]